EGHVVGMFMEGTRQKLGYPGTAHAGAAMVAMQEGVPVIPVGIDTFGWSLSNRRPFAVAFGEPMDLAGFPRNGRGFKEATGLIESISEGETVVTGFGRSEDTMSSVGAMRALGVQIEEEGPDRLRIHGVGLRGLRASGEPIDCGNAGTLVRLLAGILAGQDWR